MLKLRLDLLAQHHRHLLWEQLGRSRALVGASERCRQGSDTSGVSGWLAASSACAGTPLRFALAAAWQIPCSGRGGVNCEVMSELYRSTIAICSGRSLADAVLCWGGGVDGEVMSNVNRFRVGLVFEAHRRVYHSTLGLRVIKKRRSDVEGKAGSSCAAPSPFALEAALRIPCSGRGG